MILNEEIESSLFTYQFSIPPYDHNNASLFVYAAMHGIFASVQPCRGLFKYH